MSKKTRQILAPDLRFPEFQNTEGWKNEAFSQLFEIGSGKDYKHLAKGDVPVYGSGGYMVSVNKYLYDGESVCIGRKGTIDKPMFLSGKFWTVDTLFYTYSFKGCLPKFIYLLFQNINWNSYNEAGGVPSLSKTIIGKIEVLIPRPDEQKKIVDCLTSIDDLIKAQQQKVDALKAYKKGLMQQLFPIQGETVPKLRFPEFQDAGEWEETTLGQIAKYENGKAHEQDIVETGDFIVVNSKFISTDGEVKKLTNTASCIAAKGDILMVLSDVPNGRAIAKCFFVDTNNLYTVNQRICKLTPKKVVGLMLFYALNRNTYFLTFDDGVNQTNLKKEDVLSCPLILPKEPKEQLKISDCISSIDDRITAQSKKLEALKVHKKGLLQQLFPSVNPTTN